MAEVYRGSTPTFTLTFGSSIDFSSATDIYVTFSTLQYTTLLTKSGDDVTADSNVLSVWLTQEESLTLPVGVIQVQVNWLYDDSGTTKRGQSDVETLTIKRGLIDSVIEAE